MDAKTIYATFRARIVEEDRLINDRMLWMILSEPLFFSGLIFGRDGSWTAPKVAYFIALAVAGIVVAVISLRSVKAAQKEINFLVRKGNEEYAKIGDGSYVLSLTGSSEHHDEGHTLPNVLPYLIMGLWFIVLLYVAGSVFKGIQA